MLGISFGNRPISFTRYQKTEDEKPSVYELENDQDKRLREEMRTRILHETIGGYSYPDDFGHQSDYMLRLKSQSAARAYGEADYSASEYRTVKKAKVDRSRLQTLGNAYSWEKRKNELYSGAKLVSKPNGIETAKKAGIKTIVAIEGSPNDDYCETAKEHGLNWICLQEIGHKTLHAFSIIPTQKSAKLLDDLVNDKNFWVTRNADGSIKRGASKEALDLQEFIDIMDGKRKDLPYPIYYGCQLGTNRTYAWTVIYNILRNADRSKPLGENICKQIADFHEDLKDIYRY